MNKRQRKIRELRARFVTKLTKQTKTLSALDYVRSIKGPLKNEAYRYEKVSVDTYNKWYQFVARNPKQSADQIRQMSVRQKNKFFLWLTHDRVLFNPYGNNFYEKISMVVFVLSKPKTMENLLENDRKLGWSFVTMQESILDGIGFISKRFEKHCVNFRQELNYQPNLSEIDLQKGVKVFIDTNEQSAAEEAICIDKVFDMKNPPFASIYTPLQNFTKFTMCRTTKESKK